MAAPTNTQRVFYALLKCYPEPKTASELAALLPMFTPRAIGGFLKNAPLCDMLIKSTITRGRGEMGRSGSVVGAYVLKEKYDKDALANFRPTRDKNLTHVRYVTRGSSNWKPTGEKIGPYLVLQVFQTGGGDIVTRYMLESDYNEQRGYNIQIPIYYRERLVAEGYLSREDNHVVAE